MTSTTAPKASPSSTARGCSTSSLHRRPGVAFARQQAPPALRCRPRRVASAPTSLNELAGPKHRMVALPLHIAWSGLRILDPDRPRQRRSLYRTVLAEGMRDDLCRFLNKGILLELWPVLRKLINTAIKDVREEAFPEELLAEAEYRMTDLPKAPADEWESVTIDITDAYGKRTYVQLRPDQL
ncbi:hypothetical protein [Streptomyces mirabilis]